MTRWKEYCICFPQSRHSNSFILLQRNLPGTLPVTVYDAAEPQYIQSVDFPEYFEIGAGKAITLDDIVVRDQYGQIFEIEGSDYTIDIQATSGTTATLSGNTISELVSPTITAGSTEGSTVFTLSVEHDTNGVVAGSQFAMQVNVVTTDDIDSFMFGNVSLMYAGGVAGTDYYKTLSISGKIGSKEVVLAGGPIPSSITLITNSNSNFHFVGDDYTTMTLYANASGSTTIQAWVGGSPVASLIVTASSAAPEVNTMTFNPTTYTLANSVASFDVKTILTILDQYGVDITSSANVYYSSSNPTIAIIDSMNGIITTFTTDGTTSISVVELSGAGSAVLTLTVE